MKPKARKPRPERDNTDESLRIERRNTDQAIVDRRSGLEDNADEVVERAREQADAVLDTARDKADQKLDTARDKADHKLDSARHRAEHKLDSARDKADQKLETAAAALQVHDAIAKERAHEDEALQNERAAADEILRREREAETRSLALLLPLEREKTDRYLLTERARSDDALAHRDDFMGMVSHDLRNLLGGIAAHATLLSKQASGSDEGRRTVAGTDRIQRYVARMNRLIGDLVDVVSIDAGKLTVQAESCDAAVLLSEAVDAFSYAASEKGISIESGTAARPLPAHLDSERMLQVLANLITNAIKFTPRGGKISVRGERGGNALRLSVGNTGIGIAGNMLEAVFERFWQVGKNDQRGLGLGLYISKCIVDAHRGKIWVESKLGEGSTFHVTIPDAAPLSSSA